MYEVFLFLFIDSRRRKRLYVHQTRYTSGIHLQIKWNICLNYTIGNGCENQTTYRKIPPEWFARPALLKIWWIHLFPPFYLLYTVQFEKANTWLDGNNWTADIRGAAKFVNTSETHNSCAHRDTSWCIIAHRHILVILSALLRIQVVFYVIFIHRYISIIYNSSPARQFCFHSSPITVNAYYSNK